MQSKRRVAKKQEATNGDNVQDQILELEGKVFQTGNFLSGIRKIQKIFGDDSQSSSERLAAGVALCRIFYRLFASEQLAKRKGSSAEEKEEVDDLRTALDTYTDALCKLLAHLDEHVRSTALTLVMRVVKAEVSQQEERSLQAWRAGTFHKLVRTLITNKGAESSMQEFMEGFVEENDDVRFYFFGAVGQILVEEQGGKTRDSTVAAALVLLLGVEGIPDSAEQFEDWYGTPPASPKHVLLSLKAHRKQAQTAWLQVFGSPLNKAQRKQILDVFTDRIVPWFTQPETLMDFLTDSYNQGGATSLLSLAGVYHLMKEKNLDYPQFYKKLYSLLDEHVLHSKHRARFFRLLGIFLSSTHLPANLVASFIKRLARLALHAPPGGIVMVVPWVYNMLKKHRQCTFMIHRVIRDSATKDQLESSGMDDPFNMKEKDPGNTNAIDSSLWELQTLQSHYHPNVATLAKIISEQFTKHEYNLEDFLDHSYNGLIDAELGKDLKKAPVVEYEIPKRIVTKEEGGLNQGGVLLQEAIAIN